MATTPFLLVRDINGYNGFGLPFSNKIFSATLAQNTDKTVVVPLDGPQGATSATYTNRYIAIFEYEVGANVYVALNHTAADPAGSSFAATTSELNPAARQVSAGDTLHFLTPDTSANVTVVFYALY
jgi:hypothetical protein